MQTDFETRHFVIVGPDGTIAVAVRWTGDLPDIHYPVQMRDEHQRLIPQPYPDPLHKQRGQIGPHALNPDCWFVSLQQPQAYFQRRTICAGDFEEAAVDSHCKWLNFSTGRIELRPGHCYVATGLHAGPAYRNLVELSHYAYGGRPVYFVQRDARLHEWEIAELRQHGMLHPHIYKPEPHIVDGPQLFLPPPPRHRLAPRPLLRLIKGVA